MSSEASPSVPVAELQDVIELVIDHRGKTPKKLGGDFTSNGVPVISAIHIKDGRINWSERERYVSEAMHRKWMPVRLRENDILLTSEAPLGEVAFVPSDDDLVLSQRLFALRTKPDLMDSAFLKYFLSSAQGQSELWNRATGSTVLGIRQAELMRVMVPVPELGAQQRAGNLLRSIDRLIDVNVSTSSILESIAQTLFRSWFVDFDPVRAKMRGEEPVGMDDATAALFPDSMEESELGDIPAGWEVTSVGEFCPLKYGKSLPAPQRQPGSVLVYGSNGIVGFHSVSLLEAPAVVIGRKGTVGSVTLSLDPCWVIDTAFYCSPERVENLPLAYLSLQRLGLENMNSDAAVPGLNRENAHRLLFIIANEPIRARFAEIVGSTFAKIHSIQAEVDSLVSIRETLLPRLISGQLQVPEDLVA